MVVVAAITCMLPCSVASAQQPAKPPVIQWPDSAVNTLRTFFERVDVEEVMVGLDAPRRAPGGDEVATLSAILTPGIEGPFRFVQQQVRHEPYAGSVRGPRGTLLAASGNSLDQTLLLAGLYRARGIEVRLLRGRLAWGDAVALVGAPNDSHTGRGDPWLRWIEMAADHWWLEVLQSDRWTAMDPSFAGTAVGQAVAQGAEVIDAPPAFLRATASLRLRLEGATLADLELPLGELIGSSVRVGRVVEARPVDLSEVEDTEAPLDDAPPGGPPDALLVEPLERRGGGGSATRRDSRRRAGSGSRRAGRADAGRGEPHGHHNAARACRPGTSRARDRCQRADGLEHQCPDPVRGLTLLLACRSFLLPA